MKKLILVVTLVVTTYIYLDTYFDRNSPPPLCLVSESELSKRMGEVYKENDSSDPYFRMGLNMGNSMVMGMYNKHCANRPLIKRVPERMAYELKKLQEELK